MKLGLMSLFIVWHVFAILIVGPSNDSYIRSKLIGIYQNYFDIFRLDGGWSFYAPNPTFGSFMQYETLSATGDKQIYQLTQATSKFDHAYVRNINFYLYFFEDPDATRKLGYDKSVARFLCARYPEKDIKQLTFIRYLQKRFTFHDYQQGKKPLDKAFLEKYTYGPYQCSGNGNE